MQKLLDWNLYFIKWRAEIQCTAEVCLPQWLFPSKWQDYGKIGKRFPILKLPKTLSSSPKLLNQDSCYVFQAGLELQILLPLECWDNLCTLWAFHTWFNSFPPLLLDRVLLCRLRDAKSYLRKVSCSELLFSLLCLFQSWKATLWYQNPNCFSTNVKEPFTV